ncbi:MAG: peptidase [Gammaproteobacteria bacterium]|nr:MAG: peptidase [Gammaproteobacteria bacterium]
MSITHSNSPWQAEDRAQWLSQQNIKRSYQAEVVRKIETLDNHLMVSQYGALSIDRVKYPLYLIKSEKWNQSNKTVLVTGGVHGYETSGVQGAIRFLQENVTRYLNDFNFIVAPCISPWGYETINRWNPNAIDPNRSFYKKSPSEESQSLMNALPDEMLETLESSEIIAHFDLHETTDTDNSIFRPALASREGITQDNWNIPDGFYLVGDIDNPQPDFQKAMIESVKRVTHIAPSDESGRIIGEKIEQFGVINYPTKKLGLCAGMTNAEFITTTEVYPDSPKVNNEDCILAQVSAITGGLEYILEN